MTLLQWKVMKRHIQEIYKVQERPYIHSIFILITMRMETGSQFTGPDAFLNQNGKSGRKYWKQFKLILYFHFKCLKPSSRLVLSSVQAHVLSCETVTVQFRTSNSALSDNNVSIVFAKTEIMRRLGSDIRIWRLKLILATSHHLRSCQ